VWNVVGVLHHYGIECRSLNGLGVVQAWCPFHEDHRPSLSIFLENGWFNCFGCGWKGDLFDFVQAIEEVDDPIELLIKTYQASQSTDIRYHPYGRKFRPSSIKGLKLVTSYEKGPARYPIRRGVSASVLNAFRVLWDPNRYAVVFPVRWQGKWVGYQMRYVFAQSEPKYLFSMGFPRASVLYYSAEYGIEPRHPLLVVEGVFDALKAVTFGWDTRGRDVWGYALRQADRDHSVFGWQVPDLLLYGCGPCGDGCKCCPVQGAEGQVHLCFSARGG
jgi:hypothetical protein